MGIVGYGVLCSWELQKQFIAESKIGAVVTTLFYNQYL